MRLKIHKAIAQGFSDRQVNALRAAHLAVDGTGVKPRVKLTTDSNGTP